MYRSPRRVFPLAAVVLVVALVGRPAHADPPKPKQLCGQELWDPTESNLFNGQIHNVDKPEGQVIDAEMHPWVGVDSKHPERPNLFRLTRIERP
jgi:hypothetical protein